MGAAKMPLGSFEKLACPTRTRNKQPEAARLAKRNARERNRVLMVNKEFQRLRSLIKNSEFLRGQQHPLDMSDEEDEDMDERERSRVGGKLSKVNTLRTAIRYIKQLTDCLQQQQAQEQEQEQQAEAFELDFDDWELSEPSPLDLTTPSCSSSSPPDQHYFPVCASCSFFHNEQPTSCTATYWRQPCHQLDHHG